MRQTREKIHTKYDDCADFGKQKKRETQIFKNPQRPPLTSV